MARRAVVNTSKIPVEREVERVIEHEDGSTATVTDTVIDWVPEFEGGIQYIEMSPEEEAELWAPQPVRPQDVDVERDRRLMKFTFEGVEYDFDALSRSRIDKARVSAMVAIESGAQPEDLRWAHPDVDFGWIAADNSFTLMDAQTTLAFGSKAAEWEGMHIIVARNLKNLEPIPEDYADDSRWPS